MVSSNQYRMKRKKNLNYVISDVSVGWGNGTTKTNTMMT